MDPNEWTVGALLEVVRSCAEAREILAKGLARPRGCFIDV